MKEIGEKLKEARESIGIPLEEASQDLKISKEQLESLENANMDEFKDIINVKYLIRDYAKYLGLNKEDLVDDFNEYLFDYTSKISLEDIKEAKEKKDGKDLKIRSPYTTIKEKKHINYFYVIIIILFLALIGLVVYHEIEQSKKDNIIAYKEA